MQITLFVLLSYYVFPMIYLDRLNHGPNHVQAGKFVHNYLLIGQNEQLLPLYCNC